MKFSNLSDFHGITYSLHLRRDNCIVIGKITIENNVTFLCSNNPNMNGNSCEEKHGYRYSYSLGDIGLRNMNTSYINEHLGGILINFKFIVSTIEYPEVNTKSNLIISHKLFNLLNTPIYVRVKEYSVNVKFNIVGSFTDGDNFILNDVPRNEGDPNCFDLKDGEISYFTGVQKLEDGCWSDKSRQIMRPTKFLSIISKFLVFDGAENEKTRNRAIELFASLIESDKNIILVSDDPASIYKMKTAEINAGTLGTSCMRTEAEYKGRNFIGIYNQIPNVKIAYILDIYGNLAARALLWHDVLDLHSGEVFNFMDRIYGSEQKIAAMINWAKENNYSFKREQSYRDATLLTKEEKKVRSNFSLKVPFDSTLEGTPFLDTLNRFDYMNGYFRTCTMNQKYETSIAVADGVIHIRKLVKCPVCNEDVYDEECVMAIDTNRKICPRHAHYIQYLNIAPGYYERVKTITLNNHIIVVPVDWTSEKLQNKSNYEETSHTNTFQF